MLRTRMLTRSGLALSEVGLGCATLAVDGVPEAAARELLDAAPASGVTYYDTAPFYGRGLSERRVGDALRHAKGAVVSSKVGRLLVPDGTATDQMPFRVEFDYTYDGIMRSVEHSYQRLGLHRIDILYAHDLGRHTHADAATLQSAAFFEGGGYRAMEALRRSGDVAAIGLGVNEVEICQYALEKGDFDVFLLAGRHTLLERTGALDLFAACEKASTDIVIGGPFNSGLLVGGTTYNYRAVPDQIAVQHRILVDYCHAQDVEIGAAALQFPLRQDIVKSVVPGPKNLAEWDQIQGWMSAEISDDFWSGLEDLQT